MGLWLPWRRPAPPAPGGPPDVRPAPPVRSAAGWRELPPIQRAVDAPALVSPPDRLQPALLSWRNPSFLAPLGHVVDRHGPSGYVHDAATVAEPPADPQLPVAARTPARPQAKPRLSLQRLIRSAAGDGSASARSVSDPPPAARLEPESPAEPVTFAEPTTPANPPAPVTSAEPPASAEPVPSAAPIIAPDPVTSVGPLGSAPPASPVQRLPLAPASSPQPTSPAPLPVAAPHPTSRSAAAPTPSVAPLDRPAQESPRAPVAQGLPVGTGQPALPPSAPAAGVAASHRQPSAGAVIQRQASDAPVMPTLAAPPEPVPVTPMPGALVSAPPVHLPVRQVAAVAVQSGGRALQRTEEDATVATSPVVETLGAVDDGPSPSVPGADDPVAPATDLPTPPTMDVEPGAPTSVPTLAVPSGQPVEPSAPPDPGPATSFPLQRAVEAGQPQPRRFGLGAPLLAPPPAPPTPAIGRPAPGTVQRVAGTQPAAEPVGTAISVEPAVPAVPLEPPEPVRTAVPVQPLEAPASVKTAPLLATLQRTTHDHEELSAPGHGESSVLTDVGAGEARRAPLLGDRGPAPVLASHLTGVQRVPAAEGGALPVPSRPPADPAPAPPRPTPVTVARLLAAQPVTGPATAAVAQPLAIQRTPEPAPPAPVPPPEPVVQTITVQRTETAPALAPPPPAPAGQSSDDLLATLFDPLLRRLRAELRLERDRRGALTDLRH